MSKYCRLSNRGRLCGISTAVLSFGIGIPVYAQDSSVPEVGLTEIVVTAQKRAQNIQDVPIAITAVSGDYLGARDINSIDRIASLAPNVKIERTPSNKTNSQISIRGSVTVNPAITWEPTVGIYFDGVYIGKAQGSIFDIADLERVEVLRGPQGTLYGRNTLAGAVNLIPKKPSGVMNGHVELSYGDYDYKRLKGTIDLPALGFISAKISGSITKRDGFIDLIDNPFPHVRAINQAGREDTSNLDNHSLLLQLRAEPTNRLTIDYMFDHYRARQMPDYAQLYHVNRNGDARDIFDPQAPGNLAGMFPIYLYESQERQRKGSVNDSPLFERSKVQGHALTVALDLGQAMLKSTTAYRKTKTNDSMDLDGTPFLVARTQRFTDYEAFSQEFQIAGKSDVLDYVIGAYYFDDSAQTTDPLIFFGGAQTFESHYASDTAAWAAYGQIDFHVDDRLTITGGLRYTHEKKDIGRLLRLMPAPGSPTGTPNITLVDVPRGSIDDAKYKTLTPTVIVTYKPNRILTVYGKYAKGYKSGGFNGEASSREELLNPYRPEKVNAYEIGLKSRLLDDRLQLNVAGFWNESKDIQLPVFTGRQAAETFVLNAAKARTRGIEVEATMIPVDGVVVHGTFAYLDPKYKSFMEAGADVSENRAFPHAPKYSGLASIDWTAWSSNTSDVQLNLIGDFSYVSSYFTYPYALRMPSPSDQTAYDTRSTGRTLVDARMTLSGIPLGATLASASLWVRNAFNYNKPQNFIDFGPNFGGMNVAFFPDPRTYGVTLGIRF